MADDLGISLEDIGLEEPLAYELIGPLTEAEISLPSGTAPTGPILNRIRTRHHEIARLMAAGIKQAEISRITGYDPTRLSVLKRDPSVQELIAFYQSQRDVAVIDISQRLAGMSLAAMDELEERIEEGKIKDDTLVEIMKTGLDRIGFGVQSTVKNLNVTATATLEEIKAAVQAESKGRVQTRDTQAGSGENPTIPAAPPAPAQTGSGGQGLGPEVRADCIEGDFTPVASSDPRPVV